MTRRDATLRGPWARIEPAAIAHNLSWLRNRIDMAAKPAQDASIHHLRASSQRSPAPQLWAVAKADAYGHGLANAIPGLRAAQGIAVAGIDDLVRCRAAGWTKAALILSSAGVDIAELDDPDLGPVHIVVDNPVSVEHLKRMSRALPQLQIWLRYAGRLRSHGFDDAEYTAAFRALHPLVHAGALGAIGHFHHYASAEDPEALEADRQAFAAITNDLPGPRCTGNSAALCSGPDIGAHTDEDWLRCGLLLYGASPLPARTGRQLGLRPAMSLHARLLDVRTVSAGDTVGYGESYRATRPTRIGLVGIGYGHGVPRQLWQHGSLLSNRDGRSVRLAGRVAMDCLTVDLGPDSPDQAGDLMTLWGGTQTDAQQPVEIVAQACGTIAAELLTGLTARVPLIVAEPALASAIRYPTSPPTLQAER